MPVVSEFILNLGSPDASLLTQTGDLVIIESGYASTAGQTLSEAEIDTLQAQGRTVIAYLNVSVTDHNRSYWDDAWVDYLAPSGGGAGNRDVGPVLPGAPAWLQTGANHGLASDPGTTFGYIVDYTDPDWQNRLFAEAVHMVTPTALGGLDLDGVFLDDVGRYYQAASNDAAYSFQQAARDMITLVNTLSAAIEAANPDAYIAVNGGAYIGGDAGWTGTRALGDFLAHVDALLMESQYLSSAWPDAIAGWGPGHDFLSVEHATVLADRQAYADWARALGLIPHVALTNGYDAPAVTPGAGTTGPDLLTGGDGPNHLQGLQDDDTLAGLGGNDMLDGGDGTDLADYRDAASAVYIALGNPNAQNTRGAGRDQFVAIEGALGSAHDDKLRGSPGDNRFEGNDGNDSLFGYKGADTLTGGKGHDRLYGGAQSDSLSGNPGADTLVGDRGHDVLNGGGDDDRLIGGTGSDTLTGGAGADLLFGGDGTGAGDATADTFVFLDTNDSTPANRDSIRDFEPGIDRIDLSTNDALPGGADDPFTFIGGAGFTSAGQLRVETLASKTYVQVDTDGDGIADLEIHLAGSHVLNAADFIL